MDAFKSKLRELFGIDIRSLALFRIGVALVFLGDLLVRFQDITAHYTDEGVLPRGVLIENILDTWKISLHLINGTWEYQLVLFFFGALFGIALLVGYWTRLATLLTWLFIISIQTRNPIILQGGDDVLRLLLFWGLFLPMGSYWSIDSLLSKKSAPTNQIVSIGTCALLLQICLIYWFSAILKSDPVWRQDGTAVWYSLSIGLFSTSLGTMLLQYPTFLKGITFSTLYLEAFGPFFAFSPIWTGPLRFATAMAFIFFHMMGLNFAMELALFPYICAVAWIVFIPGWFWDKVLKRETLWVIPWRASWLSSGLAAFFLVNVLVLNLNTIDVRTPFYPSFLYNLDYLTGLDQYWGMFAPYPMKEDAWYVIPGKLRDGTEVNLFTGGGPVVWEKPPLLSAMYANDRWRSFMINLITDEDNDVLTLHYARYLCKTWNNSHFDDKQLMTFNIYLMLKINDVENPNAPYEKTLVWQHQCFD